MLHIYLAARISRHEEMRDYAEQLQQHNILVVSSWINRTLHMKHANRSDMSYEERATVAAHDISDINMAHVLILFSEEQPGKGNGRLVEFGYAYGKGIDCWVVGPLENLFLCMDGVVHLPTWEEALAYAEEESAFASKSHGYSGRAARGDAASTGAVRGTRHTLQ